MKLLKHVPRIEARAAMMSLTAAVVMLTLKFVAYFYTNSSAIFSDALETIANVAAAVFAIYALRMAHRPADRDHPYGHGKIEFLAAGFEASMILTAALVAGLRAMDALLHKADLHLESIRAGIGLLTIALIVNGIVGADLVRIGRRSGSATLEADGRHLLTDAVTSVAAILALLVAWATRWNYADPLAALLVAAYIARTGIKLMRGAMAGLMDEQDEQDQRLLRSILDTHIGPAGKPPWICSYHKLRHRHSGRFHWVDFHLVMPAHWDIRRGHEIASGIEDEIEQALGIGNATAHIEPCIDPDCQWCAAEGTVENANH